ncbi:SDR family oxidoreductase [Arthrobacter sp. 92]|uniref:SDR family oxidoreductase n=1 Tax=Arthrobacter sp. 92 TaxID=3418175 RepID=UPI003D0005D5
MTALVAVVTGGACGIGAAISARLQGVRRHHCRAGPRPADLPDGQLGLVCDFSDDTSVRAAIETVRAFGRLDVVINNAGPGALGTIEDNDDAEWHRIWDIRVMGMVRVTRAPLLRQSPSAAVVNTCSIAATAGLHGRAAPTRSLQRHQGAVLSLTQAMGAKHFVDTCSECDGAYVLSSQSE